MHGTSTLERGGIRLLIGGPLCIAPSRVLPSFQLFAQNYSHLPPPNPHTSEMAFSHRFQKVYIYPHQGNDILAHRMKSSKTREEGQNPPCWRTMNVPERYAVHFEKRQTAFKVPDTGKGKGKGLAG